MNMKDARENVEKDFENVMKLKDLYPYLFGNFTRELFEWAVTFVSTRLLDGVYPLLCSCHLQMLSTIRITRRLLTDSSTKICIYSQTRFTCTIPNLRLLTTIPHLLSTASIFRGCSKMTVLSINHLSVVRLKRQVSPTPTVCRGISQS